MNFPETVASVDLRGIKNTDLKVNLVRDVWRMLHEKLGKSAVYFLAVPNWLDPWCHKIALLEVDELAFFDDGVGGGADGAHELAPNLDADDVTAAFLL